jgi:hypothetical protein
MGSSAQFVAGLNAAWRRVDAGVPGPTAASVEKPAAVSAGQASSAAQVSSDFTGPTRPAPTVAIPAAVFTANDGWQYTGPLAEKLPQHRQAAITLLGIPGAAIRVYNPMVLENGAPKLIFETHVPDQETRFADASVSYPVADLVHKATAGLNAQRREGLVQFGFSLPAEADWHVHDSLQVTQQVGTRPESTPLAGNFLAYVSGIKPNPHLPYLVESRILKNDGGKVVAREPYAVSPGAQVQLLHNGLPEGDFVKADPSGRFSIGYPSDSSEGAWTLQVATSSGVTKLELNQRPFLPYESRAKLWANAVLGGLLQTPNADGQVRFDIPQLPPGVHIAVTNSAVGEKYDFVAGADGIAHVDVPGVSVNDFLSLHSTPFPVGKESFFGTRVEEGFTLNSQTKVPNFDNAARAQEVIRAFPEARPEELQLALELFGPFSPSSNISGLVDPARMQSALRGAITAIATKAVQSKVDRYVQGHPNASFVAGYERGKSYSGKYPVTAEQVGLKKVREGSRSMVITGGYSPISGSHGPLRPETVTGDSEYLLTLPGDSRNPLTFYTGGTSPSGWVNPNAILLTYTGSTAGGGSWSES